MFNFKQVEGKKIIVSILIGFGILIIILAIFSAGLAVGFKKARFSYQWGDNYHRMFGGPRLDNQRVGWGKDMRGDDFMNANGAVGSVIKVVSNTLYMKGNDNVEKSVLITSDTSIQNGRSSVKASELKADDKIIILGVPSSTGQIEAKLIRIMPFLPVGKK